MKKLAIVFGSLLSAMALALIGGCAGSNQTVLNSQSGSDARPSGDAETVRIGSIDWYVNYEDAMAEAKRSKRPVWLHFGENPG